MSVASAPWVQFAFCLIVAFATRFAVFGDPAYRVDEEWYLLVGERMHAGARLYADIWDRKPPGLFLIYRLAAGFAEPILAYQIMAYLAASATALLVARLAQRISGPFPALVAAALYLSTIAQLDGAGGQSPVFYNLLIAAAAWLIVTGQSGASAADLDWRKAAAMALAGSAIIVKQTAVAEGVFFGIWITAQMWRAGVPLRRLAARVATLAFIGALPTLAVATWFLLSGELGVFFHATVSSTFIKGAQISSDPGRLRRVLLTPLVLAAPLGLAAFSLWTARRHDRLHPLRGFLLGWLAAAFVGFVLVANFYNHYLLPLMVPLSISASPVLTRGRIWMAAGLLAAGIPLLEAKPWDVSQRDARIAAFGRLTEVVKAHDPAPRLLIYDGPPLLYSAVGTTPMTPLAFPAHLSDGYEKDVSHLQTRAEVARVLSNRPSTVVLAREQTIARPNLETLGMVSRYVSDNCLLVGSVVLPGWDPELLDVYSRCSVSPKR